MRIVLPDHRKVPATAGVIFTNGAATLSGILPSATIGSENTIRISLPSSRVFSSPVGPVLTTVKAAFWAAAIEQRQRKHRTTEKKARLMGVISWITVGSPTIRWLW